MNLVPFFLLAVGLFCVMSVKITYTKRSEGIFEAKYTRKEICVRYLGFGLLALAILSSTILKI